MVGLSYHLTPAEPQHPVGKCPNCSEQFFSHHPGAVCRSIGGTEHQCTSCLKPYCTECVDTLHGCEVSGCQSVFCDDCATVKFYDGERWYFCEQHRGVEPAILIGDVRKKMTGAAWRKSEVA